MTVGLRESESQEIVVIEPQANKENWSQEIIKATEVQQATVDTLQMTQLSTENRALINPQDKELFLPETPLVLAALDREIAESRLPVNDAPLFLASTSLPSKTHFETDRYPVKIKDDVRINFEITPETVVAPVYPFKARRKHINGFVRLEFSVDESGQTQNIKVVEAQPAEVFEKSAINALEKWVFKVDENHSENRRLYQIFDFDMEEPESILSKRERRCDITGSRICGLKVYN
jgi:TonB family protein